MGIRTSVEKIAKKKGYFVKELVTGRYELKKEFEIMSASAIIDESEGVKYNTSPKYVPLIIATVLFAATFVPIVVLVYLVYILLASIRKKTMKWELKELENLSS